MKRTSMCLGLSEGRQGADRHGVYELRDGTLLATDWNSGSLFSSSEKTGMQKLASGFKGPADFCVVPAAKGLTVVLPDLVQSQLRFIQLAQ